MDMLKQLFLMQGIAALHTIVAWYGAKFFTPEEMAAIQTAIDALTKLPSRIHSGGVTNAQLVFGETTMIPTTAPPLPDASIAFLHHIKDDIVNLYNKLNDHSDDIQTLRRAVIKSPVPVARNKPRKR